MAVENRLLLDGLQLPPFWTVTWRLCLTWLWTIVGLGCQTWFSWCIGYACTFANMLEEMKLLITVSKHVDLVERSMYTEV